MHPNIRTLFLSLTMVLSIISSDAVCLAQGPRAKSEAEIRTLLKKSRSKDFKIADEANEALSKLSARDIRVLTAILRKGETCERMVAAQLMVDLDRENKNLIPVLVELSKEGTAFSSEEDLLCRRGATFLLAFSTEGIRVLTTFLKEGENLFLRRSAIFAFDELTETGNYPVGSLEAMKEAIPIIAESSKLDDEVMQCMSNEVLAQIVRGDREELRKIAKEYVKESPD